MIYQWKYDFCTKRNAKASMEKRFEERRERKRKEREEMERELESSPN